MIYFKDTILLDQVKLRSQKFQCSKYEKGDKISLFFFLDDLLIKVVVGTG
jgi:hypothetical protein